MVILLIKGTNSSHLENEYSHPGHSVLMFFNLLYKVSADTIIKYIIPNEKNFNVSEHITQDERKLNKEDSEIIKNVFPDIKEEKFCFLSRFDRYFRKYYRRSSPLEIIDRKIFNIFPFFRKYGGDTVFILNKK